MKAVVEANLYHLLGLQQLHPKVLALNLHHICLSFLSLITVNIFQSENLIDILIIILISYYLKLTRKQYIVLDLP